MVTDILDQCATMGDLHHALDAGEAFRRRDHHLRQHGNGATGRGIGGARLRASDGSGRRRVHRPPHRLMSVEHDGVDATRWLLLIHQIPPKPDYLRVKIGRRLQRIGAVPVKNSVYVLPDRPSSLEDFQWVRAEITEGGGDASICQAAFVDGLTDSQIEHLFRDVRDIDYAEIADAVSRYVCCALRLVDTLCA